LHLLWILYYVVCSSKELIRNRKQKLGATNVSRVLGKKGFIITFSLDFLKGSSIILLVQYVNFEEYFLFIFSVCVIIGHIFPVQLNFKGGKGIATFLGTIVSIHYLFIILLAATWLLIYPFIRKFSVADIFSVTIFPIFVFFLYFSLLSVFVSILEVCILD
jgi:glycerol-3-phosphate acyltransferase PlsY